MDHIELDAVVDEVYEGVADIVARGEVDAQVQLALLDAVVDKG